MTRIKLFGCVVLMSCIFFDMDVCAQSVSGRIEVVDAHIEQQLAHLDFGDARPSAQVHDLADWVVQTSDHHGLPFVVVDKIFAQVYVFNGRRILQGVSSALLGLARGDDGVFGIGDRPLNLILPQERTTPSGRFTAALAYNLSGQEILWVDYAQGISLHPVRSFNAKERRLQRLASPSVQDNRITFGCINVSTEFWRNVVVPTFIGTQGLVYVLPETRSLKSVFAM